MEDWLRDHPDIRMISIAVADLNGQARGKKMPAAFGDKALKGETRMPLSALNVDIWGDDIENSPLVFDSGDRDGVLKPTERGFIPLPWLQAPSAMLPMWMFTDDGSPFQGDPRHALNAVLERYKDKGLSVVAATELEFFLIDDSADTLRPPRAPRSGKRRLGGEILSLRALDAFDAFFSDLYDGCQAMDIPAETAISEAGMGQYEINLVHGPAMKAADDAWLFKNLVKGVARKHGFAASFMAKPYVDFSGNGMHVHFSVLDENGDNIFSDGGPRGTDALRHAVGGCLAALPGSTLIFAPHANSYERLVPGAHAPTGVAWAYENRTAAIRIPSGPPVARRIEHRVAGGDTNPYLMLTAILGAALIGMEDQIDPSPPITGNAYDRDLSQIPATWATAIDLFETDEYLARVLPRQLVRNFVMTKRQELAEIDDLSETERTDLYLDSV